MSDWTNIKREDRDGWEVSVDIAPDYDYQPGYDDDIYPRLQEVPYGGVEEEPRDFDGRFLPRPIIVNTRTGPAMVTVEEIDRLTEIWGGSKRHCRKLIEESARGIGNEDLSWVVIRVTAKRGHIEASDYLGGVDYDTRRDADADVLEVAESYGMADTAIEEAARSVAGPYAIQALSY